MRYRLILEYELPDEFDPDKTMRQLRGTFQGLVMEFGEDTQRYEGRVIAVRTHDE